MVASSVDNCSKLLQEDIGSLQACYQNFDKYRAISLRSNKSITKLLLMHICIVFYFNIRLDNFNTEERTEIIDIYMEYADIFCKEKDPLTFTNHTKYLICLFDEIHVYCKIYRYPQIQ